MKNKELLKFMAEACTYAQAAIDALEAGRKYERRRMKLFLNNPDMKLS